MHNDYMYAVDRSDEYLEHYGIKGMKWGVRKAIASGNSKRLAKHYAKASKKLAKLQKQAARTDKYAKRARRLGVAAGITGGIAFQGTSGIARGITGMVGRARNLPDKLGGLSDRVLASNKPGSSAVSNVLEGTKDAYRAVTNPIKGKGIATKLTDAANNIDAWGNSNSISESARKAAVNARNAYQSSSHDAYRKLSKIDQDLVKSGKKNTLGQINDINKVSNNALFRAGAAAATAGLAGAAGYNAYRAATAKKRAAKFEAEMNKAFAGTKYGKSSESKKRRHRS